MQQVSSHLGGGQSTDPPLSPSIRFKPHVHTSGEALADKFKTSNEFARNLTPLSPAVQRQRSGSQSSPAMPGLQLDGAGDGVPEISLDGSSSLMARRKQ